MVDFSSPSCGRTSRRSSTCSARSTSGMACARSSGAGRRCGCRCCPLLYGCGPVFPAAGLRLGLRLLLRLRLRLRLLLAPRLARRPRFHQQRFVADELVTVLLQDGAGEGPAAHHEDPLVVLLQLVDQRDEIAVAADDGERVDVIVRERHLERVESEVDVGAVLVAARRRDPAGPFAPRVPPVREWSLLPSPVRVGDLGDDFAALLQRVQHGSDIELPLQCRFDADFDVVEIDKHRDLQFLFHFPVSF